MLVYVRAISCFTPIFHLHILCMVLSLVNLSSAYWGAEKVSKSPPLIPFEYSNALVSHY
ncbi:uncharacterized protein LAESUDRAFT_722175 [Laetiporus sulphureus 93-53]|uniref:Uncharacterized protein n=1 Tax=Laetiporus sulphureus 93-53 TaxID=1314785 RepID=A0A165G9L0_9APHY|nr:uncharacterized protein LAESUDRAFT_722175 [Laetiporus sulphureus 93-53]KZT10030.1 hypothetical protein LAESUDRAFT_722175 [Laetiporus sulphureus 93-53]